MIKYLRKLIPDDSSLRLLYHRLMAMAAAYFYGFPAGKMKVIAVTGTNGKTTTANMIADILMEAGKKIGLSSTVYFQVGNKRWRNDTKQSTPGRFALQKLLKQMINVGCEYLVLEATSHSVVQSRLWGINIDVAALTNVRRDHIEYHGTFAKYRTAKGEIFKNLNLNDKKANIDKVSVLNADDENFSFFNKFVVDRTFSYSVNGKGAINAKNIRLKPNKSVFILAIPNNSIEITLPMPGIINVQNALAAAASAISQDIDLKVIKKALEKFKGVPGRLESVNAGQDFPIIVDYAHTPDALDALCSLFKPLTKGRLIVVFGATGGGRDKAKRPVMGKVVEKYADMMILTNDDPYEEDQIKIIEDISSGLKRKEGNNLWKIVNRKEAIKLALEMAKTEDTVVIAGKGGERVIIIGDEHLPWNDVDIVKELIEEELNVDLEKGKSEDFDKVFS